MHKFCMRLLKGIRRSRQDTVRFRRPEFAVSVVVLGSTYNAMRDVILHHVEKRRGSTIMANILIP